VDPYTVKHHKDAARERDWLFSTYGESFRTAYNDWMDEIARWAAINKEDGWFDLDQMLACLLEEGELPNWARSLKRFRQAGVREKLRALVAMVKKRRPPWRLKAASRPIPGLDDQLLIDVGIIFDINDVDRLIVVRQVLHHAM
jgi:hypothetical protein